MDEVTDFSKTMMHMRGCRRPAFHIRESAMISGAMLKAVDVQKLDGSAAIDHESIECGSCGAAMTHHDLMLSYIKDRNKKRGWGMKQTIGFIAAVLALMAVLTLLIVRPDDRKPCPVMRLIAPWLVCDHARL